MKRVLFHLACGNSDRPGRWHGINPVFTNLGESLIKLGFDVHMMLHSAAWNPGCNNDTNIKLHVTDTVDVDYIKSLNPDYGVTWNGNSEGDKEFVKAVGFDKMIFGELGFFGHYEQTCYFDRSGINTKYSMIGEYISPDDLTEQELSIINLLETRYKKPRIVPDSFVFVPLQDETDTQITQYSPYKTMDEFMHNVVDILKHDNRKILYKKHPRAPSNITVSSPTIIEVKDDVHHYLPYADLVFGINSTVTIETLLYHQRLVTFGAGISCRHFDSDNQRLRFVATMYNRQFTWESLKNPNVVRDSYLSEYFGM